MMMMSEAQMMSGICDALNTGGWLWSHHPDSRRLAGDPGMPDIIAVGHGDILCIEVKTARGRLSAGQKDWRTEILDTPAEYRLISPLNYDDAITDLAAGRIPPPPKEKI